MKKMLIGVALAVVALWLLPIRADSQTTTATAVAIDVGTCGTPPAAFVAGRPAPLTVDTTGTAC
jgi:hypothetical protein